MTLNEVYLKGKDILAKAGNENPAFDAMCIFNFCFKLNRQDIVLCRDNIAPAKKTSEYFLMIEQRKNARPLQYILGTWDFMGLKFKVGEGVLIPRDDTEVLINESLNLIKDIKKPRILDLCSGSGAVAISLAKNRPDASIVALELSPAAIRYLKENITLNKTYNVSVLKGDVLKGPEQYNIEKVDLIVSNPPYIPTDDIDMLQLEVKNEPLMALDGGEDGLKFYNVIAKKWKSALKEEGYICAEIGINQSSSVINIFKERGANNIYTVKDINKIDRVVTAKFF